MMGNYGFQICKFVPILISIFVLCCSTTASEISIQSDQNRNDGEIIHLIKKEVQLLNKEFTKSAILDTSRRKRSFSQYTYDVKLDQLSNYFEAKLISADIYSFVCNGRIFILKSDGVYRLDGFSSSNYIVSETSATPTLTKVSEWSLNVGDRVLHAKEWEQKCFVLISNQNGTFSSLYTLHGEQMTPIFRQQIRNHGFSMAAKFFKLKRELYLIIINDNAVHSLTICPLFRWAKTYMDEIHAIQTRGAVAVETFTINSRKYIAIAQSQDAAGNFEVGTQVLRMDSREELEKVQLLWSYNPVKLQYIQILEDHFLIIGLGKESSICYWFGGIDFIQWQSLEGYAGPSLFMDEWILPDKTPVLLAARNSTVQFYTRKSTSTFLTLNSNTSALSVKAPGKILHAAFLRPSASEVYLTIVQSDPGYTSLKIYPVLLIRKEIAESQIKETESQLSQCLVDVRRKLDEDGTRIKMLDKQKNYILTIDRDLTFNGTIFTTSDVVSNPEKVLIQSIDIRPEPISEHDFSLTSPSNLLKSLEEEANKLNADVISHIENILMKSQSGNISGDYIFPNGLEIKNIVGHNTNLQLTTLNNYKWETLDKYALRKTATVPQYVSGHWTVDRLIAKSVKLPSNISDIQISEFLLKRCLRPDFAAQLVYGNVIFNNDVQFSQGVLIPPDGIVNGIRFSDVVFKSGPTSNIRGFKHALNMIGGDGFDFSFLNGDKYYDWFKSVMHIDGADQNPTGLKTLVSTKGNKFDFIQSDKINDKLWRHFYTNVLINGVNQTIEGDIQTEKLVVESLLADIIGNTQFQDLMTTDGNQTINSNLTISSLSAQKNLNTNLVNGISLAALAVKKNEEVFINSQVELENFKVNGSISIAEYATIAGKDISELGKLKQKHIYYTTRADKIFLRAPIEANNLDTQYTNDHLWEDLESKFWSKSFNNNVPGPLDLKGRKVHVKTDFNTGSLNSINLETDVARVDKSDSIHAGLNFIGDVFTYAEVHQADGKTLNGFDISEVSKGIVKVNEDTVIQGKKHFKGNVIASGGAIISSLNDIDPVKDVIFLNSSDAQYVTDLKRFKNNVHMKTLDTDAEIKVGGKINGHDLKHIYKTTAFKGDPITIPGNLQFNNSFYASSVIVKGKLNGVNVTDLLENAVYLNQPQTLNFPMIIQNGSVTVKGPSNVTSINGINLENYFSRIVYKTPPKSRINGTKTFANLSINQNVHCHLFNGISLTNLSRNAFSRSKPQEVQGKMHFDSIVVRPDLYTSKIAGIDLNNLVYIHDPESCNTSSNVAFRKNVTLEGPLTVNGLLNGYRIENVIQALQVGLHDQKFKSVEVKGNLEWEVDNNNLSSISHLFKNAVTRDTPQIISGNVEFSAGFESNVLESNPWINNVNLLEIGEDAVQIEDSNTMFLGENNFVNKLKIIEPPVNINLLDVGSINGVDVLALVKNAVRDSFNGTVYGRKTFVDGLKVEKLTFNDLMGKGDFKGLVTTSDNRTVNHAEFYNVFINNNFNFNHSKRFNLEELIQNRVTLNGDQILYGNYTIPKLTVLNDCQVTSINGIPVNDIYLNNSTEEQRIDGQKTLAGGLVVYGQMDIPNVNGYNFAALQSDIYKRSEKETINRPVIFVQPVIVNKSVKVDKHINDYQLEELSSKFSEALEKVGARASLSHIPKIQNLDKLQHLKNEMTDRSFWLEYLRLKQDLGAVGPKHRVEHTLTSQGVVIGLHGKLDGTDVYLPKGCYCDNVIFLKINDTTSTASLENDFRCSSAFVVTSPLGNVYSVLDQTVSFNQTCSRTESAALVISKGSLVDTTDSHNEVLLNEPSKGYLSDVKSFSDNGIDYLIVAYFFNATNRNHDTGTFVYSINSERLTLVQRISTSGAKRIAISNIENEWFLAVANNRDSQSESCLTNSAIYRWSSSTRNFVLLRDVRTNDAVDVVFITVKDKGVNYEGDSLSLVAYAQNGNTGDGNVVILQYDSEKKNYYLLESLRTNWIVTALDFLCIQENCYLLVVIPQEGIHFYEYRYVEGFQLSLTVPIIGTQDIGPFEWNKRIFFGIASTKTSILAEGVVAGHLDFNTHLN